MIIRYPGMQSIDALLGMAPVWKTGPGRTSRVVWREIDRDLLWVAPRWIAWLYRWLPILIAWHNHPQDRAPQPAPYFLLTVVAAHWWVAWLPRRRQWTGEWERRARVGVLVCNNRRLSL